MKAFCSVALVVLLLAGAIAGLASWLSPINPREAAFNWGLRIATAVIFPASLGGLIFLAAQPETVPNFLTALRKPRMGRGGVLLVFECTSRDGWAYIDIHYQNRFANPASVTLALQPSQNFLLKRNDIEAVLINFACGAAAYGVIQVPIAVKHEYQGQVQLFDVASQDQYSAGTGKCLRNTVGQQISTLGFSAFSSTAATLARIAISDRLSAVKWQSRFKVKLPQGVAESPAQVPGLVQEERWTLASEDDGNPGN